MIATNFYKGLVSDISTKTLSELTRIVAESDQVAFLTKAAIISHLYNSRKYRDQYQSVSDWALYEFGWENRKRVERYRSAGEMIERLLSLNVTNWGHLPQNEYHCRILNEFGFDDYMLQSAWEKICLLLDKGERLTGALIEKICQLETGRLKREDPAYYEKLVQEISPDETPKEATPGNLIFKDLGFASYEIECIDTEEVLPIPIGSNRVLLQRIEDANKAVRLARNNPSWNVLGLFLYPDILKGMSLPPNLWPGVTITNQYELDEAQHRNPDIWSDFAWAYLEPEGPLKMKGFCHFDWLVLGQFKNGLDFFRTYYDIKGFGVKMYVTDQNWQFPKECPELFASSIEIL